VRNTRNAVHVELSSSTVTALPSTTWQAVSTSVAETSGTTAQPVNITGKMFLYNMQSGTFVNIGTKILL